MKLLLREKSLCVCEIMQALEISQTRASRNLGILKDAGFLRDERRGFWVHYAIEDEFSDPCCREIARLLHHWIEEDEFVQEDGERLKRAIKLGEGGKKKR